MGTDRDDIIEFFNPRPPGGAHPTPLNFSLITSIALQLLTRNLAYLSVHYFYVFTQNFEKNLDGVLELDF